MADWRSGPGEPADNPDTREARLEFAGEHSWELLAYLERYEPGVLEEFVEHVRWLYRCWLN